MTCIDEGNVMDLLEQIRTNRGMTMADVAREMGVPPGSWQQKVRRRLIGESNIIYFEDVVKAFRAMGWELHIAPLRRGE